MTNDLLYKENAAIMRGVAITAIMLHNYLHKDVFGFTQENEAFFSQERADSFMNAMTTLDTNLFGEMFSFLGWIGVAVFVFLTGYGLAKKYPDKSDIDARRYVKHNYLKLFLLMLIGILPFMMFDLYNGGGINVVKKIFALTMLSNFDWPHLKITPGVYWYFGFTFQYYIFYLVTRRFYNNLLLAILSILSLIIYYLLGLYDLEHAARIFRACFTGWLPLFALGVWMAKDSIVIDIRKFPLWLEFFILLILTCFVLIMNMCYESWLFLPIIAVFWFMTLSKIVIQVKCLAKIFMWVGAYSAIIFAVHPIARQICLSAHLDSMNLWISVMIYVLMTISIAYFYRLLYISLLNKYMNK